VRAILVAMQHDQVQIRRPTITATQARARLIALEAERTAALAEGLGDVDSYMAELEEDRVRWRHHYAMAAVTDIATVIGGLFGRPQG
jgi:hypothetical protein